LRSVKFEAESSIDLGDALSIELSEWQTVLRHPLLVLSIAVALGVWRQRRVKVNAQTLRWLRAVLDRDRDEPREGLGCRRPSSRLPLLPLIGEPTSRPLMDADIAQWCLPRLWLARCRVEPLAGVDSL
jgi:hypothetical protein